MRIAAILFVLLWHGATYATQSDFSSTWSKLRSSHLVPYQSDSNLEKQFQKGRVKVILFWASWCEFCKAEIQQLGRLQKNLGVDKLNVVAVNVDDSFELGNPVAKKNETQFLFLHDKDLAFKKIIPKLPLTLIYSEGENFVTAYTGFSGERFSYMKSRINTLLKNEEGD